MPPFYHTKDCVCVLFQYALHLPSRGKQNVHGLKPFAKFIHTHEAALGWDKVEKSDRNMNAVAENTACEARWKPVGPGYFRDEYISRQWRKIDTVTCRDTKALQYMQTSGYYFYMRNRDNGKIFQTVGTWSEFSAASQAATARSLGLEPRCSRQTSLTGKNEWSLPIIKTGNQFDVFFCVCVQMKVWVGWVGSGCRERQWCKSRVQ